MNYEIFLHASSILAYLQRTEGLFEKTRILSVFRISLSYKMLQILVSCHFSIALPFFIKSMQFGPQTQCFCDAIACKYGAQIIQTAH